MKNVNVLVVSMALILSSTAALAIPKLGSNVAAPVVAPAPITASPVSPAIIAIRVPSAAPAAPAPAIHIGSTVGSSSGNGGATQVGLQGSPAILAPAKK